MDRNQQELQSLGLLGIYKESYILIFRQRKIFAQITLTLILPLSFIFLCHKQVSDILHRQISHAESTPNHHSRPKTFSDAISSPLATYVLIKAAYFTFLIVFSLLSTSAVVYTVACVYTSRGVTFTSVIASVVPRVWKRLMVTMLCAFVVFFSYNVVFIVTLFSLFFWFAVCSDNYELGQAIVYVVLAVYALGFVYMSIVWLLASVVTVLEESYGFGAMAKSKGLIKGKIMVAMVIFFKLNLLMFIVDSVFREYVVYGQRLHHLGGLRRIGIGGVCLVVLLKVILFGLVVQSVVYYVCKAYHGEKVDESGLSERLEGYLGEYAPLKVKDVAMFDIL